MAQDNPSDIAAAQTAEEAQADAAEQGTPDTEAAPVLNRAQRRAQARGKTSAGAAAGPTTHQGGGPHGGARPGGHAGQVRFPRTGHK